MALSRIAVGCNSINFTTLSMVYFVHGCSMNIVIRINCMVCVWLWNSFNLKKNPSVCNFEDGIKCDPRLTQYHLQKVFQTVH